MEDEKEEEKQASLFTVRNIENAMVTFSIFAMACIITSLLYEIFFKGWGVALLENIPRNSSKIMSLATLLTLIEEGVDIMFGRFREAGKKNKERVEAAKAEGRAEGRAEAEATAQENVALKAELAAAKAELASLKSEKNDVSPQNRSTDT